MEVAWQGQTFTLLAQRAAYWHEARALVVADVHFGKAAAFRSLGVPVPETVTADLARLDAALDATGARRLVVLGDLLHAACGRQPRTMEAIGAWRKRRASLEIVLVRGNHDRSAGDPPAAWDIRACSGPTDAGIGELLLTHEPARVQGRAVLCGHVHPAVRLVDRGRGAVKGAGAGSVRLACFWFGTEVAVWPAFGSFTGHAVVRPSVGDRVIAIGPTGVFDAPTDEFSPRSVATPVRLARVKT